MLRANRKQCEGLYIAIQAFRAAANLSGVEAIGTFTSRGYLVPQPVAEVLEKLFLRDGAQNQGTHLDAINDESPWFRVSG